MVCPQCDKDIKSLPVADMIEEEGKEYIAIYLTCEHCDTEMYTAVRATKLEEI